MSSCAASDHGVAAPRGPVGVGADPVLLADPRVRYMPMTDDSTPIVDLRTRGILVAAQPPEIPFGADHHRWPMALSRTPVRPVIHPWVRKTVADRLAAAEASLPGGIRLLVVEGLRSLGAQQRIHDGYRAELAIDLPWLTDDEIDSLASRFVSPPAIAPHVSGAAVDLTLVDVDGSPLDLGTAIDATPEASNNACYLDARNVGESARTNRMLLADALRRVGLVNYPTEWWHWSFGDRYWAYVMGHPAAVHGPVDATTAGAYRGPRGTVG